MKLLEADPRLEPATFVELDGLKGAHELSKRLVDLISECWGYRYNHDWSSTLHGMIGEAQGIHHDLMNASLAYGDEVETFTTHDHPLEGWGLPMIAPGLAREIVNGAIEKTPAGLLVYQARPVLACMRVMPEPE